MPVVAVNISPSVFNDIAAFVGRGLYSSPEQFLEIAAFNQVALERGATPAEVVERGHRNGPAPHVTAGHTKKPERRASVPDEQPRVVDDLRRARPVGKRARRGAVPEDEVIAMRGRLSLPSAQTRVPPSSQPAPRPADERIWGQVNRLLPIKMGCRWLMVANGERTTWLTLPTLADRMADDAATLGSALELDDLSSDRKRDELFATGLPRKGNTSSRDRFLSQYIARVRRAGEIYPGALCQYALAFFDGDHLTLTELGIEMALLKSPVLDGDWDAATSTLSDEEREFFARRVLPYVPGELSDFSAAIRAVSEGNSTPADLQRALSRRFEERWSAVMIRTHVSGVVARLVEMGLLRRCWEGRNVRYELATLSQEVISRAGGTA